ncbi:unnamed protein product [Miscanthus lutarioriparius]|uniref:Uncharacterized protein n=1 Tax=Miscanthus lutarioriparius TaxID=422564 RepID=A0A811SCF3_9POAL|nr:unnamed protein product [Miscanthus lutarioriparius]
MGNVEAMLSIVPPELGDELVKVAVFAVVQALVYLILRKSSDVFTPGKTAARSFSFPPDAEHERPPRAGRLLRRPRRRPGAGGRRWRRRTVAFAGSGSRS